MYTELRNPPPVRLGGGIKCGAIARGCMSLRETDGEAARENWHMINLIFKKKVDLKNNQAVYLHKSCLHVLLKDPPRYVVVGLRPILSQ